MSATKDQRRKFRFQQFEVWDRMSAHKVGIDSILCGSWADFGHPSRMLDIGTGCGLLSLMMMQRFKKAHCVGIDIDPNSISEAALNFRSSPWSDRLTAQCISIQKFAATYGSDQFDAIISNPPYFRDGLANTEPAKHLARHAHKLPHSDLFACAAVLLKPMGAFCLTLPTRDLALSMRLAAKSGLYPHEITTVLAKADKASKISLIKLTSQKKTPTLSTLIIGVDGSRTSAFRLLTGPFYLKENKRPER